MSINEAVEHDARSSAQAQYDLVLRGERILTTAGISAREIGVRDGKIVAIEPLGNNLQGERVIDVGADEVLLPGLVDTHVHVNEPGRTEREDAEVAEWKAKDPVIRIQSYLDDAGLLTEQATAEITEKAEAVAKTLRDGMNQDADTDPRELFEHVYSSKTPQMAEQQAMLADELAREEA